MVIGGGVMGLFTAYHASERLARVVVLERGRIGDPMTASYGRTRSFRNDYLDATYARLAHEAFRLWIDFEQRTGSKVLVRCGCLNIAKRSVTPDLAGTYAQQSFETLTRLGMRTESFDAGAISRRFPYLDADLGHLDLEGGVVDLPAVNRALALALGRHGVRTIEGVETTSIAPDGASIRVTTDEGRDRHAIARRSRRDTAPTPSCRCCPAAACRSRSRGTGLARPSTSSRRRAFAIGSPPTRCRSSPISTPASTATRSWTASSTP